MKEITVCYFVNKAKENMEEKLTLYAEWKDFECEIYVIGNGKRVTGKLSACDFEKFAKSSAKPPETYLQETKNIFSRADEEIEFFLDETTLKWHRKLWKLGVIKVNSIDNPETILAIIQNVLQNYPRTQDSIEKLTIENLNLKSEQSKLKSQCDEIIVSKNNIESNLYKKFLILLNNKKKRIWELENRLNGKVVVEGTDGDDMEEKELVERPFEQPNTSESPTKFTTSEGSISSFENSKNSDTSEESDKEI